MNMTIVKTGVNLASGATSLSAPIPTASSSALPRFVRISATAAAAVKVGPSTVAAVLGDVMVQPGEPVVLAIASSGVTHVAVIQIAAAGVVNIAPLEDA